ncbi:MAG TPA: amino acid adenylation domain-containing protein, partial [Blastocatellia bacterium]|nr:amino acid adenylation domain-containing protein [Blastocatellia bacterium]
MKAQPGSFDLQSSDRDLFELLLEEEEITQGADEPPIKKHALRTAPLSFSQGRLWFFEQMEPGRAIYNISGGLRIEGSLQIESLFDALLEIVRRQESLRTSFREADGSGQQTIESTRRIYGEDSPYVPPLVDISNLSETEKLETVGRLYSDEAERPFDLSMAPLYRARLIRSVAHEQVILITMHHIISDEWSLAVFLRELANLYSRFLRGSESELNELTVQYSDYAVWQREALQGQMLERQLDYWKARLEGAPPSVELPLDHPRPAVLSYRGDTITRKLSIQISESLSALARKQEVTLFTLLLAAYEALLFRYTGRLDSVIGTPVAGRDRVETQELIGFFVNMLPVRSGLEAGDSFYDAIYSVGQTMLEAYANQSIPFEMLVENIETQRDTGGSSIFNLTFALEQGLTDVISLPGVTVTPLQTNVGSAKFDLAVSIVDTKPALTANFEYSSDLFEAATIERMMNHLEVLLGTVTSRPEQKISELSLLTLAETRQVLAEWNATDAAYPGESCIHELFVQQSELTPDSIAIVFEEEQLTYRELNGSSNRLARYLMESATEMEASVGVCAERSSELVIALIATMKVGAAYVPIDPDYPAERIKYMIKDSGIQLAFASHDLLNRLPLPSDCVIPLDGIRARTASENGQNPCSLARPQNLIYSIYTSGSTGNPKGVAVPHRGVVNCLMWLQHEFQIRAGDRVLVKASLSFDASVWELFWPLIVGATAVVASPGGHRDGAYLREVIAEREVTVCHFVPSMLRVFIDEPDVRSLTSLNKVLCGGEAMPPETMSNFFQRSKADLHNFYGPTEASIGCTDWCCQPGFVRANIPIGRPIFNTSLYILDARQLPVPIGVPGELYIGGDGVARCYLGRPDFTADKFLPDFGSQQPGARTYRSGDLCRYRPDGNIEFLGRVDHQVKIRGFRIELGEVEAAILQHEVVRDCIVIARGDLGGDKRIVAYVVPRSGGHLSPAAMRVFLSSKLPAFMVPSHFVQLNELPLMQNGKVDRPALPKPNVGYAVVDQHEMAQDGVEELLANIWRDALGGVAVERCSNFFDLGGHSLLATKIASRIRDAFRVELPLRRIFERPVLSDLAETLRRVIANESNDPIGHLDRVERCTAVPLSHAQERLWFLDQLEPDRAVYNVVAGIRMTGPVSVAAIEQGIAEIVRRHESLRTTFETQDGEPVQIVHPFVPVGVTVIDVRHFPES